jgi:hypothetical protein
MVKITVYSQPLKAEPYLDGDALASGEYRETGINNMAKAFTDIGEAVWKAANKQTDEIEITSDSKPGMVHNWQNDIVLPNLNINMESKRMYEKKTGPENCFISITFQGKKNEIADFIKDFVDILGRTPCEISDWDGFNEATGVTKDEVYSTWSDIVPDLVSSESGAVSTSKKPSKGKKKPMVMGSKLGSVLADAQSSMSKIMERSPQRPITTMTKKPEEPEFEDEPPAEPKPPVKPPIKSDVSLPRPKKAKHAGPKVSLALKNASARVKSVMPELPTEPEAEPEPELPVIEEPVVSTKEIEADLKAEMAAKLEERRSELEEKYAKKLAESEDNLTKELEAEFEQKLSDNEDNMKSKLESEFEVKLPI